MNRWFSRRDLRTVARLKKPGPGWQSSRRSGDRTLARRGRFGSFESERDRGSVFPVRGLAGRLYSLNCADRFHDREPVPVHPEIADPSVLHLVPRTGGRLPPFASWSDPSKVALVRGGGAHPNGDKIALGNHMLYGHFEVGKCLDGAGSDLPQALIRYEIFDVGRIVLDEHLIDEAQNDGFVLLGWQPTTSRIGDGSTLSHGHASRQPLAGRQRLSLPAGVQQELRSVTFDFVREPDTVLTYHERRRPSFH